MKLSSLLQRARFHSSRLGFTMIELLVVIAILGILAASVVAALNPVEQINRGRDTRNRSDAAQILTASERFYAANQAYPWNVANGSFVLNASLPTTAFTGATNNYGWMAIMEDRGELKAGLRARVSSANYTPKIQVFKAADVGGVAAAVYACFQPASFQFKQEAANECNAGSAPYAAAIAPNGITDPCPAPAVAGAPLTAADAVSLCLP